VGHAQRGGPRGALTAMRLPQGAEIAQMGGNEGLVADTSGDAARLTALRTQFEDALAACESARDLPGLSREYRLLLAEIRELHTNDEGVDPVDQLAKRRATKGAAGAAG